MITNFILIMVVSKLTLAVPHPQDSAFDPFQYQDFQHDCSYWNKTYASGELLKTTCVIFQCHDGRWIFQDLFSAACGSCEVHGEPHVYTYELNTNNDEPLRYNQAYKYGGVGTYTLTQLGLTDQSPFKIEARLVQCKQTDLSCVTGLIYHQPGITILVVDTTEGKEAWDSDGSPFGIIKVIVNGIQTTITEEVTHFDGEDGTVLIFFNKNVLGTKGNEPKKCLNIVGSKGLSVNYCENTNDYDSAYIWAMPSLKQEPASENGLYGLCDQYTKFNSSMYALDYYTMKNGTECSEAKSCYSSTFADTWKAVLMLTSTVSFLAVEGGLCTDTCWNTYNACKLVVADSVCKTARNTCLSLC